MSVDWHVGILININRTSKLEFDDALLRVTATSTQIPFGDSPEGSSKLTISGSEVNRSELRRLHRRDNPPETVKSHTFPLDDIFSSGKDRIITVDTFNLYCNDCDVSGGANTYFRYQIDTDFLNCVDKVKDQGKTAGVGKFVAEGIDNLGCIGDAADAIFNLLNDEQDSELPVIDKIVTEAVLGIQASENIAAKLNFEASGTGAINIACSFPGAVNCLPSFLKSTVSSSKSGSGLAFSLGSWTLSLNFTYGLTVSATAKADLDVTLPVTASVAQGELAQLDIIKLAWQNTFKPKIAIGQPDFSASNPEVCLGVAIGPSVSATLASSLSRKLTNVKMSARLDLPKVEACFKPAHNVDQDCNSGSIQDALEMDINADFGLAVELDTIFKKAQNLTPQLYRSFELDKHCFGSDTGGDQTIVNSSTIASGIPQGSTQPGSYPLTNANGTKGNDTSGGSGTISGGTNSTGSPGPSNPGGIQSNITSLIDCTGVAPSPGGQPCAYAGGGPVTCTSLYSWSCPNGDSGPVPADTICACGAFRHPGWQPSDVATPACTEGIYCYNEQTFGVCGPAGIEPPQPVAPGTICAGGSIVYPS